jgi:predicted DNA binding CopG/RHH family protein
MAKRNKIFLTDDELELESSIAAGEWSSTLTNKKRKLYENAAKKTLAENKKEARVNIRMKAHELSLVKSEAEREGIPYQTLMSSILHKYLTGQLVERKLVDEIKSALRQAS